MQVNTTSAAAPETFPFPGGGSDGWGTTLTLLADGPFFECQDCGGIEEVPYDQEPPDHYLCSSCTALFGLELSTLLDSARGVYR